VKWFRAVIMALNQLGNALMGGDPDMTVSARAGYAREHDSKGAARVCTFLDWVDPRDGDSPDGDHCDIAVKNHELNRNRPSTP